MGRKARHEQISYSDNSHYLSQNKLFFALAEQLKIPLLQISRSAELARMDSSENHLDTIENIADTTMQLVDSLLLSTRLHDAGDNLALVPVSLSAVLHDAAHKMEKNFNGGICDIELHIAGKYGPIMAHPGGLSAALINLGQAFIEVQAQREQTKRPLIKLAAHRTRNGISAGLFSDIEGLNSDMFSRSKRIYGSSRQPLAQLSAHNGAGIFIADSLLETMSSGLRVAHHQKLTGLAATFSPSQQMALV
jgi:light-regulated signal transduction histidine kinase (bacteriophytochrome)